MWFMEIIFLKIIMAGKNSGYWFLYWHSIWVYKLLRDKHIYILYRVLQNTCSNHHTWNIIQCMSGIHSGKIRLGNYFWLFYLKILGKFIVVNPINLGASKILR